MRSGPPELGQRLLRWMLPDEARDEVLADLAALWTERDEVRGRSAADRWYWGQVVGAVVPSFRIPFPRRRREEEGMSGSLGRDLSFAWTQLRRHPGVGTLVVGTLALGIGATTAIFSAVHGVLLEDLPFEDPERLVMITTETGASSLPRYLSGPDFEDLARQVPALDGVAAFLEATVGPMTAVERPEHILTTPVTWNVFQVLGVDVAHGRPFHPDDAAPAPPDAANPPATAAIISHAFWQRYFGGDPDAVGQVVYIWGGASEIVGILPEDLQIVLPPELNLPPTGDVWQAIRSDLSTWARGDDYLRTVARLAPGATLDGARQQVIRFAADLRGTFPHHASEATRIRVTPVQPAAAAPVRAPLWLLMGAVLLVLLIACANVANLLLARGAARRDEMAVRTALGAGPDRLVRQLLTESALMAGLGAAGGLVLALAGVEVLHAIRPPDLHRLEAVRLDLPVLGFTVVLATAATVLSGLLPAVLTARSGPGTHLASPRGGIRAGGRSRSTLIVVEVALSVTLLVGAGLLVRTFQELQTMPLGFEPEGVLTVTATQSSRPPEERRAYESELLRAAGEVPGVQSAGIVFPLPMNGVYERTAEYAVDGRETDPGSWTRAYFRTASPSYFGAMGLQMRRGRGFTDADENDAIPVVILDERLATAEFPASDPVGQSLWVRGMQGDTLRASVVGVVEHAPQWDHRDPRPTMYFPRILYQSHEVSLVARVRGNPAVVGPLLSDAVRRVDDRFPADLVPMSRYVQDRLARSRFLLILMQIFGVLALGLSGVGLYGVLSYAVRQRRREMGLRLALGARGSEVTGIIVRAGLRLTAFGVLLGLAGALVMGRGIRSQLFRVHAADPGTLAAAAGLVLAVALLASVIPAVRAARVEPATCLQEE